MPTWPAHLITTEFDASSTSLDVVRDRDLRGTSAIVTGGSAGLGRATAEALARAGAAVTVVGRDPAAVAGAAAGIEPGNGGSVHAGVVDLADPASVARFTADWTGPLTLLVLNAGVVTGGLQRTAGGWELQLATNHLGHLALATGLRAALRAGADAVGGARVVVLSSTAHMRADIDLVDPHFARGPYDPQIAYARSKTANALFAVELTRRWQSDGITANAVNPGGVRTGLQRHFGPRQLESLAAAEAAGAFTWKTVEQGAATTVVAAVHPAFAGTGGHYLDDCREAYPVGDDATLVEHPHGVKAWALDPASAERLWVWSERTLAAG